MHDPPSHSLVRKKLPKTPKPVKPSKPSFAPEVTRRGGGPGHPSPKPGHGAYMQHALERKTPNAYEEKIILGSKGYAKLQRLRQQRYKNEVKAQTRGHDFGDTITEGFIKGSLGAAHLALPIEMIPQAYQSFRHPVRRLTQGGQEIIPLPGGFKTPEVPKVEAPQAKVAGSLRKARELRAQQEKGYSAERSARVGKAQAAYEEAGGGIAGHRAALAEHRGELPKTTFDRLQKQQLTQEDMNVLAEHAYNHPELQHYEKVRVVEALRQAVQDGRTPTRSEIKLLQRTYGQDAAKTLAKVPFWHHAVSALNIPRSLTASFDVSAPFRQGLVAGAGHPKVFAKAFPGMFKALGSERAYQGILGQIHERPTYGLMKEHGVKFTELTDVTKREEAFMSDLAERIPVVGHVVRASGRAYTGFLDQLRADIFDSMVKADAKRGINVEDRNYLRGIARYANAATGRGGMGPLEHWAPAMNSIFFSPRLIAARLNMLNPVWYAKLPAPVRKQALKSMSTLLVTTAAGLEGAHRLTGGQVGTDPRSADFAKLRYGNLRIDPLGGFQQYGRLGAQLASGKIVSSTTGKTLSLGPGFGKLTRKDIAERFVAGKLNPTASAAYDLLQGQTFTGGKLSLKSELASKTIPLVLQDAYDEYKQGNSLPLALLVYGGSAFGLGMQSYGTRKPKSKSFGGGRGGGSSGGSLLRRGGSGGSSSLLRP